MKTQSIYICLLLSLSTYLTCNSQSKLPTTNTNTWTLTYLKSTNFQKDRLKEFLEKNWFAMDSIAVTRGLINKYELLENIVDDSNPVSEWDFIVAVEYFTKGTYSDIADKFEAIRKSHTTIKVDGLVLKDIGKIVRSETVKKSDYLKNDR
jgi:hypothetical protein